MTRVGKETAVGIAVVVAAIPYAIYVITVLIAHIVLNPLVALAVLGFSWDGWLGAGIGAVVGLIWSVTVIGLPAYRLAAYGFAPMSAALSGAIRWRLRLGRGLGGFARMWGAVLGFAMGGWLGAGIGVAVGSILVIHRRLGVGVAFMQFISGLKS